MKNSVEFKAYCSRRQAVRDTCSALNSPMLRKERQTETYFAVPAGRLKLRQSDSPPSLIFHQGLSSPMPTAIQSHVVDVEADAKALGDLLGAALGVRAVVTKYRETYLVGGSALVSVDDVDELGDFLHVEVDVERAGGLPQALQTCEELKKKFQIAEADLTGWSYAELRAMRDSSVRWRAKLREAPGAGRVFLLDGASCAGKTTLVHHLSQRADLQLDLAPRYTTRKRRANDEPEYLFVSYERFNELAAAGAFIEYRDFEFGMSYGLPWEETLSPLLAGRNVIGIIDLGHVRHVKNLFPEAVTILVSAGEDTIRERLIRRGYNRPHEIEERLENARRVRHYQDAYDYVVQNDEDMLEEAEARLVQIIRDNTVR